MAISDVLSVICLLVLYFLFINKNLLVDYLHVFIVLIHINKKYVGNIDSFPVFVITLLKHVQTLFFTNLPLNLHTLLSLLITKYIVQVVNINALKL